METAELDLSYRRIQSVLLMIIPVPLSIGHQINVHPTVRAEAVGLRQKRALPVFIPQPPVKHRRYNSHCHDG